MAIYVNFKEMEDASDNLSIIKTDFIGKMNTLTQTTVETTDNDWKGTDANTFVSQTKTYLDRMTEQYDEFITDVKNEIINNSNKFTDTQNKNINMINELE